MPYPSLPLAEPLLKEPGVLPCGGKAISVLVLLISSGFAVFCIGPAPQTRDQPFQPQAERESTIEMDAQATQDFTGAQADVLWNRKQSLEAAISKLSIELRSVDIELKKQETKKAQEAGVLEDFEEDEGSLRGPRIWARCSEQDHLLDQFDRDTLQVALGRKSYLAIWDEPIGHSWSGIPKPLAMNLKGRSDKDQHATVVALGAEKDYYFAQFGRDAHPEQQWAGPASFTKAFKKKPEPVEVVTFGPADSWFIRWADGKTKSSNLPKSLKEMLAANSDQKVNFLSIAGIGDDQKIDDAAWFLRWSGNGHPVWRLRNGPSALYATIEKVERDGGVIRSIEFGGQREWVLRYAAPADEGYYEYNAEC